MRKWLLFACIVLLFGWGCYALIFDWLVPKTAVFAVPARWRMIPFRQSKDIVLGYLGAPLNSHDNVDEWSSGTEKKKYVLRIYYASDTIVAAYSIHYRYSNRIFSRDYVIDSASIR